MGSRYSKFKNLKGKFDVQSKFRQQQAPAFVFEFIHLLKSNKLKHVPSQYKDVYLGDSVFVLEKITKIEYCRRKRLNRKLIEICSNVVVYNDMYWQDGFFYGKMVRYDMDLFEYLKTEKLSVPYFLSSIVPTLKKLHSSGIYLQDIKPENIFLKIDEHVKFYFADLDYAFMADDFPLFVRDRPWIRTKQYSPELGRPKTPLEARRNDIYAIAVMVGRIEAFYNNGLVYNVFMTVKGTIMNKTFDDKWKIDKELVYSRHCANFIVNGVNYRQSIHRFLTLLQRANNYSA